MSGGQGCGVGARLSRFSLVTPRCGRRSRLYPGRQHARRYIVRAFQRSASTESFSSLKRKHYEGGWKKQGLTESRPSLTKQISAAVSVMVVSGRQPLLALVSLEQVVKRGKQWLKVWSAKVSDSKASSTPSTGDCGTTNTTDGTVGSDFDIDVGAQQLLPGRSFTATFSNNFCRSNVAISKYAYA